MKAEVRNIDFVPLTPLTFLPFTDVDPEYVSVAAVEDSMVLSYKSTENSYAKLVLLDVNFGSRDTIPLCVPTLNVTTDEDGYINDDENNCTEIIFRRDGEISYSKHLEFRTQSPIGLQSIGMNLVLGTWVEGQTVFGALIKTDLVINITNMLAPVTSVIKGAATPEDIFVAFGHAQGVLVKQYDYNMRLRQSMTIATNEPVAAIDVAYTHVDGLSLVIATKKNVSITTFLRSYDRTFVQTNQATIATMLSTSVPVLDIDQSVMPNGDLALTFSTIQEIHVQVFKSSIFGTAPLLPIMPMSPPINTFPPTAQPVYVVNTPISEQKPPITPEEEISEELEKKFPSWATALLVLAGVIVICIVIVIVLVEIKKQKRRKTNAFIQQDPDLIAYTKMNV